ncbi:MAG TPA: hypothetical protein VF772_12825 [Terriglobales bacterium]
MLGLELNCLLLLQLERLHLRLKLRLPHRVGEIHHLRKLLSHVGVSWRLDSKSWKRN